MKALRWMSLSVLAFGASSQVLAVTRYQISAIPANAPGNIRFFPEDINVNGVVAGYSVDAVTGVSTGFRLVTSSGSLLACAPQSTGVSSRAYAIDDLARCVGETGFANGDTWACRWFPNSNFALFFPNPKSVAWDISSAGVVGSSKNASGFRQAFIVRQSTGTLDMLSQPSGSVSDASGVNATGSIAGSYVDSGSFQRACLWSPTSVPNPIGLTAYPGLSSSAVAINDNNLVLGQVSLSGFLWDANAGARQLAFPGGIGIAVDLNNSGVVIGQDSVGGFSGSESTGFAYIDKRLMPGTVGNWSVLTARGINANGDIVGTGTLNGQHVGYIAKPITTTRLYVSDDSTAAIPDGLSWSTAFRNISDAIAIAANGDEIWIEQGLYAFFNGEKFPYNLKSKQVVILGGFKLGDGLATDARPWSRPTIVNYGGSTGVELDKSLVLIDGLRFIDARLANSTSYGAIRARNNSIFTVSRCYFFGCYAPSGGACIDSDSCSPQLSQNIFAYAQGVGVPAVKSTNTSVIFGPTVQSCVFYGGQGQGLQIGGPLFIARGNTFISNAFADAQLSGTGSYEANLHVRKNVQLSSSVFSVGLPPFLTGSLSFGYNVFDFKAPALVASAYSNGATSTTDKFMVDSKLTNPFLGNFFGVPDWHLLPSSPCRGFSNTGFVYLSPDIDGEQRPNSNFCLGADEYIPFTGDPNQKLVGGQVNFVVGGESVPGTRVSGGFLQLLAVGSGEVIRTLPLEFRGNGSFSVPTNLDLAMCDVRIKARKWLSTRIPDVVVQPAGILELVINPEVGDIDRDDEVTIFDYIYLSQSFGLNSDSSSWLQEDPDGIRPEDSDLDYDGEVTIFDYIALSENFGKAGGSF